MARKKPKSLRTVKQNKSKKPVAKAPISPAPEPAFQKSTNYFSPPRELRQKIIRLTFSRGFRAVVSETPRPTEQEHRSELIKEVGEWEKSHHRLWAEYLKILLKDTIWQEDVGSMLKKMSRDVDRVVVGCLLDPTLKLRRLHSEDYYKRRGNAIEDLFFAHNCGQRRKSEKEKWYSIQWA